MNEELRLQNDKDDPFTQNIVYAPTNTIHETREVLNSQETVERKKFCDEIPPQTHKEHMEDKLASPLLLEKINNQLPQCMSNRHTNRCREENSEIPPLNKEIKSNPPVYTTRTSGTRQQINYDSMNWGWKQHLISPVAGQKATHSTRKNLHK